MSEESRHPTLIAMKYDQIYERRQSANRMGAVLLFASVAGGVIAVLGLLAHGWVVGLAVLLLSVIAYALSRLFDLLGDLLGCIGRVEEELSSGQPAKEHAAAGKPARGIRPGENLSAA